MTPSLESAKYLSEYKIQVQFSDGFEGVIDLKNELWGEVFEPLQDINIFRAFEVDPELSTIVWSTGADLAPEFLYQRATA